MSTHKTPEQIAQEALKTHFIGVRTEVTDAALVAWMITAINADRAQRSEPTDAQVLAALNALIPEVDWSAKPMGDANPTWVANMRAALRAANNVQEDA